MNEYLKDTLANGLRLVTIEMPHLHSAEMACYLQVGGQDETEELAGISHFLEHIIFRGTASHPTSFQLERAFESIGGAVNASTDAETTCYHSRLHPRHLGEGAALFASMLRSPLFHDVDVERKIILEEALEDLNEQGEEISTDNLTSRLLWPGHPLSLPTVGTAESISRIDEAGLRRHHARYYSPANTVVAVAGNVRRADALAAVELAFGSWQGTPVPVRAAPPQAAETAAGESVWVKDSDSQLSVQLAFGTPGRGHRCTLPLRVLQWILSWGGASRLMLRLREELGLTYNVEANLSMLAHCGCFTIDLSVAPENMVPAVEEVLNVLTELCDNPIPEDELAGVKRAYLFDLEFNCDHTEAMVSRFGWGELAGYMRTVENDRRDVATVTEKEVTRAARDLFVAGNLKLAVVGPWRTAEQAKVEQLLSGFRRG